MSTATLEQETTRLFEQGSNAPKDIAREVFHRFRMELAAGRVRATEPDALVYFGLAEEREFEDDELDPA